MNPIDKLTEHFKEFPGIGERQARRFVYFLLHKNSNYSNQLAKSIIEIDNTISICQSCFIFFYGEKKILCEICSDPKTDQNSLLIIEKDADYESIKKSKKYNGMYFILGGLVPIVTKETPNFIRIKELKHIIEMRAKNGKLKEIILALSINPQGEHTDLYIRGILSEIEKKYNIDIVSMGRGLSTGTELEYSDSETIKNALQNRA